jgi:Kdo2-lipid IVA lauroyltransferase/acyltransferase
VSKNKSKLHNGLGYFFYKCIFILIKIMPFSWSRWIWKNICLLAFKLLKQRRLLTIENIRNARERGLLASNDDDYSIAKKTWANLGIVGSEFLFYSTRTPAQLKKLVTVEGEENLKKILAKKKGAVMVTGHLGNWELLGIGLSVLGYPLTPVVKTQENSSFDQLINEKRHAIGIKTIPNKGFLRPIIDAFKRNEIVPFLIDQDAGGNGVKVDYFGREASIPPGAVEFSLRTGTPVFFAYIYRKGINQHVAVISEEIQLNNSGDYPKDLHDNIALFMSLIQDAVRKNPTQWLWMHSLWPTNLKI